MSSPANGSGPAAGADSAGAAGGSASPAAGESASLAVQELVAGYGEVVALDGVTVR